MWKLQITVLAALSNLGYIEAFGKVGKCDPHKTVPLTIPFKECVQHTKWRVAYVTDFERNIDNEHYTLKFVGDGKWKMTYRKIRNDKQVKVIPFEMKYVNKCLVDDFTDDNGRRLSHYYCPIGITKSFVILFYGCSDNGNSNIDYRVIAYPEDLVPDESEFQQLLATDKAKFPDKRRGTLRKLPEILKD